MIGVKGYPASEVMEPILSTAHTYVHRHVLTNIHTHKHAGKLLCAMIHDLTCYIIKMPLPQWWERMAWQRISIKEETNEKVGEGYVGIKVGNDSSC